MNHIAIATPKSVEQTKGVSGLTYGKEYRIDKVDYTQGFIVITNDNGFLRTYDIHRFHLHE